MRLLVATAVSVALVFGSLSMVSAADEKKPTAQQEKMKACNAEAGDKKGDERKAFMSNCLKAGAPAGPMTQQDKMKVCNTKAGDKKGDEREAFMSECLKTDKKS
jgi:psiF repeat-containing protein